ncbi:sensor histidine kinase [Vallitalea sp.]|jgi:two-component system sensor histidine kinase YesM|uniref:sensor histidine kinase n=1 Tax=Vallitalea sp. TaxID=1882829 RepID=UPI0025DB8239|nr:histidine kinase [Vallitalea sp.]MCT4686139.1 histidine kinase [Vallitalea sp.]
MNRNYITQIYLTMALALFTMIVIIGFLGYYHFRDRLINEIVEINQNNVAQLSDNIHDFLSVEVGVSELIASDVELIEYFNEHGKPKDKMAEKSINDLLSNILEHLHGAEMNLFNVQYVGAAEFEEYDLSPFDESWLSSTTVDDAFESIYRNIFCLYHEIEDPITGESYGYIKLIINEALLARKYINMNNLTNEFFIMNDSGEVISHKNKSLLGNRYFDINLANTNTEYMRYEENDKSYSVFVDRIPNTSWHLVGEVDEAIIDNVRKEVRFLIIIPTIIAFMIIIVLNYLSARRMKKPIKYIYSVLNKVSEGDLTIRTSFEHENEFSRIGESFNEMVVKIGDLLDKVALEEKQKRLVEIDFLRAQINPHFIYNTLISIRFYVEMERNEEATEMLYFFTRILRKTLSRSEEFVTVSEELDILKSYVELQKHRYTEEFDAVFTCAPHLNKAVIPNFILQPVVENSIYYNANSGVKNMITVDVSEVDSCIEIVISDDGIGISSEKIKDILDSETNINRIGLNNVNERIKLIYGNEYGLEIKSVKGSGTTVIYRLPLMK